MAVETGPKPIGDITERMHTVYARSLQVDLLRAYDSVFWIDQKTVELSGSKTKALAQYSIGFDKIGRKIAGTIITTPDSTAISMTIVSKDDKTAQNVVVITREAKPTYVYKEADTATLRKRPIIELSISNSLGTAREIRRVIRDLKSKPIPPVIPL